MGCGVSLGSRPVAEGRHRRDDSSAPLSITAISIDCAQPCAQPPTPPSPSPPRHLVRSVRQAIVVPHRPARADASERPPAGNVSAAATRQDMSFGISSATVSIDSSKLKIQDDSIDAPNALDSSNCSHPTSEPSVEGATTEQSGMQTPSAGSARPTERHEAPARDVPTSSPVTTAATADPDVQGASGTAPPVLAASAHRRGVVAQIVEDYENAQESPLHSAAATADAAEPLPRVAPPPKTQVPLTAAAVAATPAPSALMRPPRPIAPVKRPAKSTATATALRDVSRVPQPPPARLPSGGESGGRLEHHHRQTLVGPRESPATSSAGPPHLEPAAFHSAGSASEGGGGAPSAADGSDTSLVLPQSLPSLTTSGMGTFSSFEQNLHRYGSVGSSSWSTGPSSHLITLPPKPASVVVPPPPAETESSDPPTSAGDPDGSISRHSSLPPCPLSHLQIQGSQSTESAITLHSFRESCENRWYTLDANVSDSLDPYAQLCDPTLQPFSSSSSNEDNAPLYFNSPHTVVPKESEDGEERRVFPATREVREAVSHSGDEDGDGADGNELAEKKRSDAHMGIGRALSVLSAAAGLRGQRRRTVTIIEPADLPAAATNMVPNIRFTRGSLPMEHPHAPPGHPRVGLPCYPTQLPLTPHRRQQHPSGFHRRGVLPPAALTPTDVTTDGSTEAEPEPTAASPGRRCIVTRHSSGSTDTTLRHQSDLSKT
ncbi:hypothetical protein NESM_000460400 [Novymonas esmeraldas]|uniref:Uncharacterized protein n=1 Tax=Novymonas esmeraldas TaxID=1808958 RepID=A0AAW0ENS9_9TRYP